MFELVELNRVLKNPLRVNARVAYVYPGKYEVMTSSLAHDIIYTYVNRREDVYLERFTADKVGAGYRSIETGSPLRDFDAVFTTLHYELDVVELVEVLESSGLPARREDREIPVIAGGPVVMANPAPYTRVVDAFVVGEVEATIDRVVDAISARAGERKKAVLEELSQLDYVYVPGFNEGAVRRYAPSLDDVEYPVRQVFDPDRQPAFGLGFKLELSRGCLFHCSFCMESRLFQPFRHRSLQKTVELAEKGLEYNRLERVVLYALSFPVTREDVKVLEYLAGRGVRAVLPSLRLEKLGDEVLELIRQVGQRELTLAPESFSVFAQRVLMKYPGLVELAKHKVGSVVRAGFDVKLYLIYGVKGTGAEDVLETVRIARELASMAKERGRRLVLSFNPLIPKARTPFAYIGMMGLDRLSRLEKLVDRELRGFARVREFNVKTSFVQASLSLGGGQIADLVLEWSLRGGGYANWVKLARERGVDLRYVYNGLDPDSEPPWSNIVVDGLEEKVLRAQVEAIKHLVGSAGEKQ